MIPDINDWDYDPITLRYDMDWTLSTLADRLGVDLSTTKKWSNGTRRPSKAHRALAWVIKHQQSLQLT